MELINTGVTNYIDKRVIQHNEGIKDGAYKYSSRPVSLVFYELFTDYNLAI